MSARDLDEFTCGICHEIFNDPVVTKCCRQSYCRECIEEWLAVQNNCPNDRQLLRRRSLFPVPRLVANLLNNMNVKCDYVMNGCEVVTTFGELAQHVITCDKRPQTICQTCGFPKGVATDHNCVDTLLLRITSLADQVDTLEKENQEIKSLCNRQSWVVERARMAINEFVVEEPSDRIDCIKRKFFIEICQNVIFNYNTFADISEHIYLKINYPVNQNALPWHAFVFTSDGAESMVRSRQYMRIRFDKLVIELFTSGKLS